MDKFMDTPIELIRRQIEGNAIAPLIINQLAIPSMIKNGGGAIVNITSSSGYASPNKPAGDGGWSLGYGMSKGAMHRISGILKGELGQHGIKFFNVQPGFISTERIAQDMAKFGFDASAGAPTDVVAKVVTWLVTNPEADRFDGVNIEAQQFCHERNLLPAWPGPRAGGDTLKYDLSGYNMHQVARGKRFDEVFGSLD
jgi:NAD(P)-dependent dehydrogenase (short-subunit alcohol dehydrogenase family)